MTAEACVGNLFGTLDGYNQRAAEIATEQSDEFRNMLMTMISVMKAVTSSSETSIKQLSLVESQLQQADTLEDLRKVKVYTASCLNSYAAKARDSMPRRVHKPKP